MTYDRYSLDAILRHAVALGASDVHVVSGVEPRFRIDGQLRGLPDFPARYTIAELRETLQALFSDEQRAEYDRDFELDMSYTLAGVGRFRLNVYRSLDGIAAAFRPIADTSPSIADLGVPDIVEQMARAPRGLVLVTGPTGSGKSTTLTAMVDLINTERDCHIITVEDPIEFVHASKRALVTQREVGADTRSFAEALRRILRQDPDVILIGELRDLETIRIALTAAETGQLVLATLHTQGAAKTLDRIVDAFPASQQAQIKSQLASTLRGVISQTLLPRASGRGRVLATEVLVQTPAVSNLIHEGQVQQLYSAMQTGSAQGMHTMDQSLRGLVERGLVSQSDARALLEDSKALDNLVVYGPGFDSEDWSEPGLPPAISPATVDRPGFSDRDRDGDVPRRELQTAPLPLSRRSGAHSHLSDEFSAPPVPRPLSSGTPLLASDDFGGGGLPSMAAGGFPGAAAESTEADLLARLASRHGEGQAGEGQSFVELPGVGFPPSKE